jgi:Tol biopolymer transport system component
LDLADALSFARQIADALEAAHEQGIIHRDLKPANVKVRADGTVKVLDFGLAKALDPAGALSNSATALANSPTLTSPAMTQAGLILGTAAYMSPEQARGRVVDKRADIWAFGAVLFEMLTGTRAFPGEDVTDTLAAVVRAEPDWSLLPPDLSPTLVVFLRRCLQKDPKQRLGDIRDVRLALGGAFDTLAPTTVPLVPAPRSRFTRLVPLAVSSLIGALATLAVVWPWSRSTPPSALLSRTSVMVPANRPIATGSYPTRVIAISPNGTDLVYTAFNVDAPGDRQTTQLVLRSLATLATRDLPGTNGGRQPFFSPNGQWVGFFTQSELKKVSLAGGSPVTVADKINGSSLAFGVWTKDDTIIFGTLTTGLRRVSAEGGAVTDLTKPDPAKGDPFHLFAALTPSSRTVLFSSLVTEGAKNRSIDAVDIASGQRRIVVENARTPTVLGSGHLLFQRDEAILIAPFDLDRLSVTGPAVPLIDAVRRDEPNSPGPVAQLAVSSNGTLAYVPAVDTARTLGLVGRNGVFEPLGPPPSEFSRPRVSPDGNLVAFVVARGPALEVHVYDRQRGSTTKLTQDGRDEGMAWRPDNRSLAVYSSRGETRGISLKNLDGTERLLVEKPPGVTVLRNASWSPDGTLLAYTVQTGLLHDIWVLTMGDKPTTEPLLASAASEHTPVFSPNGQWLAFVSDESGRGEIYIQKFPKGERLAVSTSGGSGPAWRRDGKELFFQGTDAGVAKMMAVSVTANGSSLSLGKPVPLFDLRVQNPGGAIEQYLGSGNPGTGYDVLPDGRFVMVRGPDPIGAREIVLVQNWFEELKRLVPTK